MIHSTTAFQCTRTTKRKNTTNIMNTNYNNNRNNRIDTNVVMFVLALMLAITSTTSTKSVMAFSPSSHILNYKIEGRCSNRYTLPSSVLLNLSTTGEGEGEEVEYESDEVREERLRKERQEQIFWAKQKALAASMSADTDAAVRKEQLDKFAERRLALVSDTIFFSILLFSILWSVFPSPNIAFSYEFGALLGTAYSYGLGKYVETIGGSIDDEGAGEGAGVGSARFAFLILLFVILGKFRGETGLVELPAIAGFFTYQLASLNQGLKEYYD
mmetsp:Transcript_18101/g.27052  ORF Transcript_18101/g.27052 Transcript_18101/m.27052 type:complete len:272 (-) Transcript_18101:284-1099(-)